MTPDDSLAHGLTLGKRYTFREDCNECLTESWERQRFGRVDTRVLAAGTITRVTPPRIVGGEFTIHMRAFPG